MSTNITVNTKGQINDKRKDNNGIHKVIYSLKPLFIFEHIFGVFRFCIKNNDMIATDWRVKGFGLFLAMISAGTFGSFLLNYTPITEIKTIASLIGILEFSSSILCYILYIAVVIIHLLWRNAENIRIVSNFAEIDSRLNLTLMENFYKTTRRYNYTIIFATLVLNSVYFVLYSLSRNITNYIYFYIVGSIYTLHDVEILFVCVLVHMLKVRLVIINNSLDRLVKENEKKHKAFATTIRQDKMETKLHELSQVYDVIGETSRLINNLYNFQIFMSLISTFINVLLSIWVLLYSFQKEMIIVDLILSIGWSGIKLFYLLVLSLVCDGLLSVRGQTKVLVNELVMDYDLQPNARAQAKAFTQLIEARPLTIHVYDMFTVDITLMLKFISVSTTYLIIIIQITNFV
ncbi:uncharacterized protein LOC133533367 [Cydia pomonella]|uniref:uncharacterized protein LOC133533367 n=1 Tax=Cydia pomonella TaxID=82600 RepID=UPI002ADDA53C|nr:uncharacterized protein LOC133533367 [Cydia pomonella]